MKTALRFRACLTQTNVYRILFASCGLTTLLAILAYTISWRTLVQVSRVKLNEMFLQTLLRRSHPVQLSCSNVLTNMVRGRWVKQEFTQSELDKVQRFHHTAREEHFLPYNLQRSDNRCGNVTFENLHKVHHLLWFRALCDAEGDAACCYNNKCVARKVEQCTCHNCYDLRQRVHAELATWTPTEPLCQMKTFHRVEDLCQVLHGMTIYFIGDSLLRHVYAALLQLVRADTEYGPLMKYTAPGMRMACNEHNMYLGMCAKVLDRETRVCRKTVKLKYMEYALASQSQLILEAVKDLRNVSRAILIFGIGIHDNFDAGKVVDEVLLPVSQAVSKMDEPRPSLLWSSVHAPGLLKSPRFPAQSRESMKLYNAKIREILKMEGIPEFNTFNVTDGMMSYDGLHYGKGVNHAKAQIFLNYLLEFQRSPKEKGEGS